MLYHPETSAPLCLAGPYNESVHETTIPTLPHDLTVGCLHHYPVQPQPPRHINTLTERRESARCKPHKAALGLNYLNNAT
jgi:hypothetical protein